MIVQGERVKIVHVANIVMIRLMDPKIALAVVTVIQLGLFLAKDAHQDMHVPIRPHLEINVN